MERWTEERLDDLKGQVERLEQRTDAGFRELRQEMDRRFDKVDKRFESLDGRLYAIHRTLILFLASMFAAMTGLIATLVVTQL